MASPTSAAAVANTFLDIQATDPGYPPIDQMKLQKLVYYSQAWYLAYNNGNPLFEENIYAWPWGPVIPPLYGPFREAGRGPIDGQQRATVLVRTGGSPLDVHFKTPPEPPGNVLAFLRSVWDTHKAYTGIQLSNATHAPGEPWSIVKQQYGNLDSKPLIPNSLIYDVFRSKLAPAAAPAA
jgi:uncharacterized phage-associated protein